MTTEFEESVPEELRVDSEVVTRFLVRRLRAYLTKHAERGTGVVGLSGGVDSSVVASLTIQAVGLRNAYFYYLPSASTSKEDAEDALELVRALRIAKRNFQVINIDRQVDSIVNAVGRRSLDRLAIGNVKARLRMILVHAFAQRHGALVVGTGDKSEITIGYFTKFGDGGVDVLPIGDLFKTQVRQLAAHLGLPERIYRKPPSPGLWAGQSAEGELGMDYFMLDRILYHRFDLWEDEEKVSESLKVPIEEVRRIMRMVKRSQHKRYPPETFKLSFRSHGSDWRYPREWSVES